MENGTSSTGDLASAALMFTWVEYLVCFTMLILSLLIGVYYGWFKKQDTVAEYMLGGKKMSIFPVTMSLVFSHTSGVTLLGIPAEVYSYGTQYLTIGVCNIILLYLVNYFYLPVFFHLQLNSVYEYLELRFDKSTRIFASFLFAFQLLTYIPIVVYVPALAFNQVTGVSVHIITPVVSFICIFYTLFGGLKAVVWTDALQSVFTVGSTLFVIVLGYLKFGVAEVFRINEEGGRLEIFNMSLSPFERNTFWSFAFGSIFFWAAGIAVHPGAVQRFIAVPTLRDAKWVMIWSTVGFFVTKVLVVSVGILLYAAYHDCDPVAAGMIKKTGQILPFFVMDVARNFQGLTGLFISGVLSAALSTMSASLNTVAGTIYEDFVLFVLKGKKQPETTQNLVIKIIVLVLGLVCIALVFVVENLGTLFQMSASFFGMTCGALFGVFSLGLLCPRANPKGALWGSVSSLVIMIVIVTGAQYYESRGQLKFPGKVTSVDGCPANLTASLPFNASELVQTYRGVGSPVVADDSVPLIFQLSYTYYSALGFFLVFLVGLPLSYLTERPEPRCLDPKLFSPPIRRFLPTAAQFSNSQSNPNKPGAGDYILVNTDPNHDLKLTASLNDKQPSVT